MDKLLLKLVRTLTELGWREQRKLEERLAFIHLPKDLQEIASMLAEGWTDNEITSFLELELGDIQRARQRLMQLYSPS